MADKRFSYEPERVADDLFAIPLPLHDGSPVNAYVAIGGDGIYLIDGGLDNAECQATLYAGLAALGFQPNEIKGLIVTHGHHDHVGAAEKVLENKGELLAHRIEAADGRRQAFDDRWLVRHGLPADRINERPWRPIEWPMPTRVVEDHEQLRWGNLELEVLWCPGHTRGLICLLEPKRKLLFTTDHVMRRAPAPISLRQNTEEDPLGDYLSSVRKLKNLPVDTVLPGHGRPFHGLNHRLANIETEIAGQLERIRERLSDGPATAYEVLHVDGLRDRRPTVADRYALAQVVSRLEHLVRIGDLTCIETRDGCIRYALAA